MAAVTGTVTARTLLETSLVDDTGGKTLIGCNVPTPPVETGVELAKESW
jgi:hypothetical protein